MLGADGNFKLMRKRKTGDPDDVSLVGDRGYFASNDAEKEDLDPRIDDTVRCKFISRDRVLTYIQPKTCSGFKAGDIHRQTKAKGVAVSGVLSVTCKHCIFRAKGTVDLRKGERYLTMLLRSSTHSLVCAVDSRI